MGGMRPSPFALKRACSCFNGSGTARRAERDGRRSPRARVGCRVGGATTHSPPLAVRCLCCSPLCGCAKHGCPFRWRGMVYSTASRMRDSGHAREVRNGTERLRSGACCRLTCRGCRPRAQPLGQQPHAAGHTLNAMPHFQKQLSGHGAGPGRQAPRGGSGAFVASHLAAVLMCCQPP